MKARTMLLQPSPASTTTRPTQVTRPKRDDIDTTYKVSYSDIKTNYSNTLGSGTFGKVYTGTLPASTQVVALKYLQAKDAEEKASIEREIDIMAELTLSNAPYIIKLTGYANKSFFASDFFIIATPIAKHGSLEKNLKTLCLTQQYKIMSGIGVALEHLHDRNIIHCDMKAENVLVDEDYNAVLADLGLSKREDIDDTSECCGTPIFLAIELLDPSKNLNNNKASDIYALGMTYCQILLKMASTEILAQYFSTCSTVADIHDHLSKGNRLPIPSEPDCPKGMASLIKFCWNENPKERPAIKDANTALAAVIEEARHNEAYFAPF